ncbi:PH domain-containing protein [Rhodococcus sp. IEGM 1408]|uniref:PH domain-containing protein n=1 Tax=Rhodococcus sp. IEGM 1408 TaxID=3082220 RepID=UPI00295481B7|nr:PH domain-containing protein [Rhodococcus sp. IEGM 1408]MDV8000609.1 PH domain-containing protein [Rhodococcus sp. IEGM 1408]
MPEPAVPLRSNGDTLVSAPAPGAGGAHALREPDPSATAGVVSDSGEGLLTTNRVLVTAPRHRIEKRTPFLWVIEGIWSWAILAGLQVAWFYWDENVMGFWNWVALGATIPFAFMSIVVAPWWRYIVARWDVSDTAVCSRKGWWTTQFRIAPLSRLQTVYTTRNLFERWFGLATVHASTASAQGTVEIRGLALADAEALAQHLIAIANLDTGDGT